MDINVVYELVYRFRKPLQILGFNIIYLGFESPVSHVLETLENTQFQGFSHF